MTGTRDFSKRTALGIAVALLFFALVEVALFAVGVVPLFDREDPYVGFAGYSPLFVPGTSTTGKPVFKTATGKLPWFNPQQFAGRKADGVTRIFCLGGSTTFGRPYADRTSFCGWLRAFLPAVDPARRWEVINAGGISYASYRVVRLMDELADREPDLFVVYTGHNEFLEERTYGRLLRTPELVRDLASLASRLRLYTVLSDIVDDSGEILASDVETVLDRSVGPEAYHRDDAARDAVLGHFRTSLERMTRLSEKVGAGLIFVTPASNIGDFSPFKAEPDPGLQADAAAEVSQLALTANGALNRGNPDMALAAAEQGLALDPRHADLLFAKGRALRALGRTNEAREAFIAARDEDIAPLRALTSISRIVSEVASREKAGLLDFVQLARERSQDGIPDSELFLDHVHPTIEGNRMLALAIVDEMIARRMVYAAETWNDATVAGITERVERAIDENAHALARASLSNVLLWAGKVDEAERLGGRDTTETWDDPDAVLRKAELLRRAGRGEEALAHYREAAALAPRNPEVRMGHGILLSELGRKAEARTELETAARLDDTLPGVHYELGVVLKELGEIKRAEAEYRTAIRLDPRHADAYNNLGVILAQRGDIGGAAELFASALRADPDHRNASENLAMARMAQGR